MQRGEIYLANLDPNNDSLDFKQKLKIKPVLIVSNNASNKISKVVTIVPLTSNIENIYPFEVFIDQKQSKLPKPAKIQCNYIKIIAKYRLDQLISLVEKDVMHMVDVAIKLHLDL